MEETRLKSRVSHSVNTPLFTTPQRCYIYIYLIEARDLHGASSVPLFWSQI